MAASFIGLGVYMTTSVAESFGNARDQRHLTSIKEAYHRYEVASKVLGAAEIIGGLTLGVYYCKKKYIPDKPQS